MKKLHNVDRMTLTERHRGRPMGVIAQGIRVKAWRTIRARASNKQHFTLGELLDVIATGAEKDAKSNVLKYLAVLERYGVIVRLDKRVSGTALTSPGHVVWRLHNDLGWFAPVWRQTQKVLWNPNTNASVALPEPQEGQHD